MVACDRGDWAASADDGDGVLVSDVPDAASYGIPTAAIIKSSVDHYLPAGADRGLPER